VPPQLIEINTNAGGGLLNALLARAQQGCCDSVQAIVPGMVEGDPPEHLFMEMFLAEWRAERGEQALSTIAIVDATPEHSISTPSSCCSASYSNGMASSP